MNIRTTAAAATAAAAVELAQTSEAVDFTESASCMEWNKSLAHSKQQNP